MSYTLYEEPIKDALAYYSTVCTVQKVAKTEHPDWPRPNVIHHRLMKAHRSVLQVRFYNGRAELEFNSPKDLQPFRDAIEELQFRLSFSYYEISASGTLWLVDKETLEVVATTEKYINGSLHLPRDGVDRASQNGFEDD